MSVIRGTSSIATSCIECPVCHHSYEGEPDCTQCGSDLRLILGIWNQATHFYNHALTRAKAQCWTQALEEINHAILYVSTRPELHLCRGKILAHLHRYRDASEAWGRCLKLDSEYKKAENCLTQMNVLLSAFSSQEQEGSVQESIQESVREQKKSKQEETLISISSEEMPADPVQLSISSKISTQLSKLQPRFDSIFHSFSQALISISSETPPLIPA